MPARVQKAKKEVIQGDDELKLAADGKSYLLNTKEEALKAVELGGSVTARIDAIKTGQLAQLEAELTLIRKGLNDYQAKNEIAEIKSKNFHSDLVERTGSMWVWEDKDIPQRQSTVFIGA